MSFEQYFLIIYETIKYKKKVSKYGQENQINEENKNTKSDTVVLKVTPT